MKTIAALITVHDRKEKTLKCLHDLFLQQGYQSDFQLDVYMTDDGCTDGTPEAIARLYPDVHIIQGDGSLFWNRGMYAAWKEATKKMYDFFFWLNDDTFLCPDCIMNLLLESKRQDFKGIVVGSTCAVGNPAKITYGGWQKGHLIQDVSQPQPCDAINGNIVLISQAAFQVLGTNDPYFRHAAGDTDYGLRAKKKGVPCFTGVGLYGECDLHEHPIVWMDPSQPFKKRWNNFLSPLGNNPFEFFYFKRRHYGLFPACLIFVTNWIHFFLPWFWPSCYKNQQNG